MPFVFAAGVPLSVAVPLPLSTYVTLEGNRSGFGLSATVIGREPVVVTVKQLTEVRLLPVQFTVPPTPNLLVLVALVIFGSVSTIWVMLAEVGLALKLLSPL